MQKTPPPSPVREEEEEEAFDLDGLLDEKLSKFLAENKVAISPAIRQSAMKKMMSSTGATLLAGMILGYILTNNLPMILALLGKKYGAPPQRVGVQPQMTEEQIRQQVMMRQQQMNQRAQQSNESLNQQNQLPTERMESAPGSSSIPLATSL